MSQYIRWPNYNQIGLYPTASAFPVSANNGAFALAEDTDTLYVYSTNSNTWVAIATPGDVAAITALNGDGTATGPGVAPLTLATVNSNVGSFGDASHTTAITVNAKGLTTAITAQSIQIAESQVTNLVADLAGKQPTGNYITALTGDATASGPGSAALTLATVNGSPGSFGSASTSLSATVNGKGLLTSLSSQSIQIAESQVTNLISDLAAKVGSVGVVGSSPNADAASIAGSVLTLQPFSSSFPGVVPASGGGTANFLRADGSWSPASTGTVTSVSVVSANGLAGTVATSTTTPAITLSTTINSPILAGNGTAISAASVTGTGSTAVLSVSPSLTGTLTVTAPNATTALSVVSGTGNLTYAAFSGTSFLQDSQVLAIGTTTASNLILRTNGMTALTIDTSQNATFAGTVAASNFSGSSSGTNTGDVTLAAVGASPNANAASLSSQVLNLQPFSSSFPGVVSASGGGSTNFLRADGTWAAPAGTAGITALTGDGTATGPGSVALTLATVNSNVGSFGTASSVSSFTVNGKGLITAASNTSIQIAESQVTNLVSDLAGKQATGNYITALTGDVTAAGPGSVAATLATVNTNTGSFGSSTSIPSFTVNGKGLITAASGNAVVAPAGTLSGATLNSSVVNSSLTSVGTLASLNVTGTVNLASLTAAEVVATDISNNLISAPLPGNAILLKYPTRQIFTSGSGTYTTPTSPSPLYIKISMVGAGGGGGASGSTSGGEAGGGGGGGGGTIYHYINGPSPTYSYGVGTGGSGGTTVPANSQPGGNTTFGTLTADGGSGGSASTGVDSPGAGATGGATTGSPTIGINGGSGGVGIFGVSVTVQGPGGYGGASAFGGSGGGPTNGAGSNGIAYGAGGAGGAQANGGNGANGYIIVEEYYQ